MTKEESEEILRQNSVAMINAFADMAKNYLEKEFGSVEAAIKYIAENYDPNHPS